jgi:hypothetical protein
MRKSSGLGFGFAGGSDGGFFAAGHNGGSEAAAEFVGELVDFCAAINFDGFTGGIDDDFAVMADAEVFFDLGHQFGFDVAIEEVG